jgi:hypothetical protein
MAVISSLFLPIWIGQLVAFATAKAPYVLPGDAGYPSTEIWSQFNATLGGTLIEAQPYGAPCYAATYNAAECLYLAQNKGNSTFRESLPGKDDDTSVHKLISTYPGLKSWPHVH